MADVTVGLDSSDIPVVVDALECLRASLEQGGKDSEPHPTLQQVNLLINTFATVRQPEGEAWTRLLE